MKSKKTISEQNPDARLRANTPDLPLNSTPPRRTTPPSPPRRTTPPSPPRSTTPPVAVRPTHQELENLIKGKIIRPNNINITSADGTHIWNVSGVNFIVSDLMYCKPGARHMGFFINLSEIDDEEKLKVDFMDKQSVILFVENGNMRAETLAGEILRFEDPRFFKYLRENIFEKSFYKEPLVNENKNTKKKVIRLTETQVKNLIGKIVEESVMGKEPIKDITNWRSQFIFKSGTANPIYLSGPINQQGSGLTPNWRPYDPQTDFDIVVKTLVGWFQQNNMVNVLKQYRKGGLPKFITIGAGTSSTGSDVTNASVGTQRLVFLEKVVTQALIKMGVDAQYVKSFISRDGAAEYTPTKLDRDFFNKQRVEEDIMERFGVIQVNKLEIRGLNRDQMRDVQFGLNTASSQINTWVFDGVDEDLIVKNIKKLDSWDDVKELSQDIGASARWSSLEAFINDQLFDDPSEMRYVFLHLTNLAINSQLPRNTVRIVGDKISIGL